MTFPAERHQLGIRNAAGGCSADDPARPRRDRLSLGRERRGRGEPDQGDREHGGARHCAILHRAAAAKLAMRAVACRTKTEQIGFIRTSDGVSTGFSTADRGVSGGKGVSTLNRESCQRGRDVPPDLH